LQPEHLGDVALKLSVTGNTITANVIAQNAHVRDLLLANQQQLARSLSDAGLSLGNFSVDVSGGNAGFTHQQAQQHRASARPGAFDVALAGDDVQWTDPRFGPSLLPAGKSLVLNYLV
jgi:flagellar hook-length control protein FliK